MGEYANKPLYNVAAWLTALAVSGLSLLLIVNQLFMG
jgi:Mn2+/Fe2+ NRAMP family transporter